jgi:hypothetical protein
MLVVVEHNEAGAIILVLDVQLIKLAQAKASSAVAYGRKFSPTKVRISVVESAIACPKTKHPLQILDLQWVFLVFAERMGFEPTMTF